MGKDARASSSETVPEAYAMIRPQQRLARSTRTIVSRVPTPRVKDDGAHGSSLWLWRSPFGEQDPAAGNDDPRASDAFLQKQAGGLATRLGQRRPTAAPPLDRREPGSTKSRGRHNLMGLPNAAAFTRWMRFFSDPPDDRRNHRPCLRPPSRGSKGEKRPAQ